MACESFSVAHIQPLNGLTVIIKLRNYTLVITKINLLELYGKLESPVPDGVIHVRQNPRRHPTDLGTRDSDSRKSLLALAYIGGIVVQTYQLRTYDVSVGVIHRV